LAEGLFAALYARKPKVGRGLASDIRGRIQKLITLPGEGGWHPLTIATQNLHQLYNVDREWTRTLLLPYFDPTRLESEAAWCGFIGSGYLASEPLFKDMRPHFLAAFAATTAWTSGEVSHLGQHLVLALEGRGGKKGNITAQEARRALRDSSDAVRLEALSFLRTRTASDEGWKRVVVPFFRDVWPRDRQFQTADTSYSLVLLLEDLDAHFPEGVRLVGDFLTSSPHTDTFVFQFGSDREHGHSDLTRRFPRETLTLLSKIIDEKNARSPYGLAEVVTLLVEAEPDLREDERWQRLRKLAQ
jgi:hypothetical protein